MYVDENIVAEKVKQRQARIETYANSAKVPNIVAAMYVDEHAPYTTNKKMLKEAGYDIDVVTVDNFRDVIHALAKINIKVIVNSGSEEHITETLNKIINESVPECWGGPDVQEYIDISASDE